MSKYLVLYRSDVAAAERMAGATPEEQRAGMQAWMDWFAEAGTAVVDGGSPLSGDDKSIGGYSVMQAESRAVLDELLSAHPHRMVGSIELFEFLPMPGM